MPKEKIETLTIFITPAIEEEGFMFDIFDHEHTADCFDPDTDEQTCTPVEGGVCTDVKVTDAISFAADVAKDYIKNHSL